ncbi:hypothetical protein ABB37_07663 [Leptomonas pyrrhocoris]|uniref:LisH domain-containing protein n=1 Tax=Leptomonas pyrrhocoris TaxID=157538 RepID=A0A0M9FVE2_LEPPY|nr:hypothetical protein ABB37_07663 [Leptomonas pyrrhocoris]XP_015655310.1 hypothetical protein ABB37_07663 [Leptomonas pyrrhocoris]KPA76870.1 hypothetical protein ABB37_07663 [Leptomonas pyrrhocoris]KPA76871.1 hypothetical protein ABB37_07663 [Leptomonas pyrrhocoris]|eukprot:XP_015655309.1 hypothetical protein ABB37_07663 [Leptomonas pyrrhocoris]
MDDFDTDGAQHLENGHESNAALLQLQDAFVSALTSSGALGKIRAQLRATALSLLRGDDDLQRAAVGDVLKPASLSAASKISLLLLYDFLQFHHLRETAGVLEVEGSVHLLSGEQDTLLGGLRTLPGEGPLLERLVESCEKGHVPPFLEKGSLSGGVVPDARSRLTEPNIESPSLASSSISTAFKKTTTTTVALPENEDVLREYQAYEPSITFSDVDGVLEDERQCDEAEDV